MSEVLKSISELINLDRYYKIIPLGGLAFSFMGAIYSQPKLISAGILTFLYGLWAWMMGAGFHIKADIKLSVFSKWKPVHYMFIWMVLMALSFGVYFVWMFKIFF